GPIVNIRRWIGTRLRALDPHDDASLARALGRARAGDHLHELESGRIEDAWGAARFVIDILRRQPELRRRFPGALGEGRSVAFCRWLSEPGPDAPSLSKEARHHVEACFRTSPGARVRRIYEQRADLQQAFPLALTSAGQGEFLRWLDRHGRAEC